MARRAVPRRAMPKRVAVVCQGGGTHAAFTVGVLTEILRDIDTRHRFDLVGLSGTSAGALCALMVWYGLVPKMQGPGSVPAAITQVNQAWNDFVAQTGAETLLNLCTYGACVAEETEIPLFGISAGAFSLNPYRAAYKMLAACLPSLGVRKQYFDLDAFLNAACPNFNNIVWPNVTTRLLIGASEVVSGFETVFDSSVTTGAQPANVGMMIQNSYWRQQLPLTLEGVAASGTLPVFREAEQMGNHYYWDGLYSNNPPIREFFSGPPQYVPDEIWIVRINPQQWPYPPQTHAEIEDRQNELMGNLSLNKELDFIFAQQQQAPPIVRTIKMTKNTADNLCYSSKFDRGRAFTDQMRQEGRAVAQDWLGHWPNVGTYPTDT
jgi:NTE family protein